LCALRSSLLGMPATDPLARAQSRIGTGRYVLGAGGVDPHAAIPDTAVGARRGCDGPGFIAWCLGYARHHPGFTHGWDWVNADSMIVEAETRGAWFLVVSRPEVGAVLAYPSVELERDGRRDRLGHAALILDVPTGWSGTEAAWSKLRVAHCHSSIQRRRGYAIDVTHAVAWAQRASFRGASHPGWRTRFLRYVHGEAP
jgi:hypothetical protein